MAQVVSTTGAPPAHGISNAVPVVVDPAVNNTVANFATTDNTGGSEPSIAINPSNTQQAVISAFSGSWSSGNAPLWYTTNGGQTWTKESSITPPPGRISAGCPCDQTFDYDRNNNLFGTILIQAVNPNPAPQKFDVVSGSTTNPASAASWTWNGATAQLTNNAHSGNSDQPWLLVNRDTGAGTTDNTYVAYDEFNAGKAQVAASLNAAPPNFTVDNSPGSESPGQGANPGLRMAKDPRNGWMYSLWQTAGNGGAFCSPFNTGAVGGCGVGTGQQGNLKDVTLHLNRSTDGGATWALAGNGASIHTGNQDEYDWSFGGVNTLQGGIDHATVDPSNGDVYLVYGRDTDGATATNYNSIFVQRLSYNGANLDLNGAPVQVNAATNAALPSVAVTSDGTVGVLFETFDGNNGSGIPTFSAHLSRSTDHGVTWTDTTLKSYATTGSGTSPPTQGQRDMGDFLQLKANGNDFYGTFVGNRQAFSPTANNVMDPIFFSTATPNADLSITKSGTPNPVTPGGNETYTITVHNNGPFDAVAVTMNDPLPAGTTFVSLVNPGWVCTTPPVGNPGTVSCTIADLAATATATFTLTVHVNPTVPSGTVLSNTATVTSVTPDLGPSPNSANVLTTVSCANNITGNVPGSLYLSGGSWCIRNASIGGQITGAQGATIIMTASTLNGQFYSGSGNAIALCGNTLRGPVTISGSTGFTLVGDTLDDACPGNTIGGSVTLSDNHGGTELADNLNIGGSVNIARNSGAGPFPGDNRPEIEANKIASNLMCSGDSPAASNNGRPNKVGGTRYGECATPPNF
ncbi:MAG TPA: hypothetical protein VG076_12550 [Acidimicrobiales bacterium]|nr:hypothetical protein [Acidimicrobiales bacterium]